MTKIIGITFFVPNDALSMFSNGIRQNVIYFFEVLYNLGYNVYLVTDKPMVKGILNFDYEKYKTEVINDDIFKKINFDIVFQMGLSIPLEQLKLLKRNGCKLIAYKCGNDYVFDMEHVLFTSKDTDWPQHANFGNEQIFDQVWCNEQMKNTNYHYWKTRYRCPVIIVPFIWSPMAIEKMCNSKEVKNKGLYYNRGISKNISIFEPNLNVVKFALPSVFICENAYRFNPDKTKINKIYITNALNNKEGKSSYGKFNQTQFSRLTYSLDLYKDKKLFIESRYNSVIFMTNHADIAVSHQWENPLNYLYLDLAWMGWPIIHNAYLCKDVGYYYDDFNYEEAGKLLNYVIDTHDKVFEEYLLKNRKKIERFLTNNKDVQMNYKILIDNLFI